MQPSTNQTPGEDSGPEEKPGDGTEQDLGESLSSHLREMAAHAKRAGAIVIDTTTEHLSELTHDVAKKASEFREHTVESAQEAFSSLQESIRKDPAADPATLEQLIARAPDIGSTESYASAWETYHKGKEAGDEEVLQRGRVECFIAFSEAGIDIATFGDGPLARGSRLFKTALAGANLTKAFRALGPYSDEAIESIAEQVAEGPAAKKVADTFLEAVKPTPKQVEPSQGAGEESTPTTDS